MHICKVLADVRNQGKLPLIQMEELDFLFCFIDQRGCNDILFHSFPAGMTSTQDN